MQFLDDFVEYLVSGSKQEAVESGLGQEFSVDSPTQNKQTEFAGLAAFREWVHTVGRELYCVTRVETPTQAALEFELDLIEKSPSPLPMGMMLDLKDEKAVGLRVYHSLWALHGEHRVRSALLSPQNLATVSPDVERYHQALESGKVELAMSLFEESGYVREPSGGRYGRRYDHPFIEFFQHAFRDGGVRLNYHSFVDGQHTCAAEYTCYGWGTQEIPPQAGMEFWDRASSGRFQAVRIYDDVSQPLN